MVLIKLSENFHRAFSADDVNQSPRALRVVFIWVILWSAPVLLLSFWLGSNHTLVQEGIFFSKAALVTFGGAYAVLPYVAQMTYSGSRLAVRADYVLESATITAFVKNTLLLPMDGPRCGARFLRKSRRADLQDSALQEQSAANVNF